MVSCLLTAVVMVGASVGDFTDGVTVVNGFVVSRATVVDADKMVVCPAVVRAWLGATLVWIMAFPSVGFMVVIALEAAEVGFAVVSEALLFWVEVGLLVVVLLAVPEA